ncbi:MAG: hypothetical protein HeimAB125_11300 [Candidatus Heimdallarchaeota archaeon AB_125]|nr:MAG: hypothetical protein HeimAB125_11300 [Candidatus Heimdallarchaeota archaeon AB_125]
MIGDFQIQLLQLNLIYIIKILIYLINDILIT